MCRLTALISADEAVLLSDVTTRPNMSIIRQSYACQERQQLPPGRVPHESYKQAFLNGDGYGIGWYDYYDNITHHQEGEEGGGACVFVSSTPAWNDSNLAQLSDRIRTRLIFAHVRAAGPLTPVGQSLCHPFRCGKFIFMHNGVIGGFERVQRTLLGLVHGIAFDIAMAHSAIDSAVAFAIFLTELCPNPVSINQSYEKMNYDANAIRKAMEKTVLKIRHECEIAYKDTPLSLPSSLANFLVSDGHTIIATRYAWGRQGEVVASCSLYYITGSKWAYFPTSNNTPRNSGIRKSMVDNYHMVHTDPRAKVAIVSSEPLNTIHDEWTPVPHNHTLVLMTSPNTNDTLTVLLSPLTRGTPEERSDHHHQYSINNSKLDPSRRRPSTISDIIESLSAPASMKGGYLDYVTSHANTSTTTSSTRLMTTIGIHEHQQQQEEEGEKHGRPFMELRATAGVGGGGDVSSSSLSYNDDEDPSTTTTLVNDTVCSMEAMKYYYPSSLSSSTRDHNDDGNHNHLVLIVVGFQDGHIRFYDTTYWNLLDARIQKSPVVSMASIKRNSKVDYNHNTTNTTTMRQSLSPQEEQEGKERDDVDDDHYLLFTGGDNELRVWDVTKLWYTIKYEPNKEDTSLEHHHHNHNTPSLSSGTKIVCLYCIKFNPNPGRILSLAVNESTQQLYAGFNNTSLISIDILAFTKTFGMMRTKSKTIKFFKISLSNQSTTSYDNTTDEDEQQQKEEESLSSSNNILKARKRTKKNKRKKASLEAKASRECVTILKSPTSSLHTGTQHYGPITCLLAHDRGLLSGGGDGQLLWWPPPPSPIRRHHHLHHQQQEHSSSTCATAAPPGAAAARAAAGAFPLVGHRGAIFCLTSSSLSSGGEVFSGSADGTIRVWFSKMMMVSSSSSSLLRPPPPPEHLLWNCRQTLYHNEYGRGSRIDHHHHDDGLIPHYNTITSSNNTSTTTRRTLETAVLSLAVVHTNDADMLVSSSLTHVSVWSIQQRQHKEEEDTNNNNGYGAHEITPITRVYLGQEHPPSVLFNDGRQGSSRHLLRPHSNIWRQQQQQGQQRRFDNNNNTAISTHFFPAKLLSLSTELPNILAIAGGDTVRIFHLVSTPQQQQQQAVKQEEQSTDDSIEEEYRAQQQQQQQQHRGLPFIDDANSDIDGYALPLPLPPSPPPSTTSSLLSDEQWLIDFIKQCGSYRSETLRYDDCVQCAQYILHSMENIGFTVRLLDVPQQHDDNDNEEYDDHNNTLYNTDMAFDTKVDNDDYDGSRSNDDSTIDNIMKYRNSAPIMMMMNPVIIARLGWDPLATTIVLYSHYDVVPALSDDAYAFTGINGRIYGRGSADCKGPLGAQLLAVKKLLTTTTRYHHNNNTQSIITTNITGDQSTTENSTRLPNIIMISEGMEERGSTGFRDAIKWAINNNWIGPNEVSAVISTNSQWILEDEPCVCYAMRGVIDLIIEVKASSSASSIGLSQNNNNTVVEKSKKTLNGLPSGIHGGILSEPLLDLMSLCQTLVDNRGFITIPGFYDDVRNPAQDRDNKAIHAAARAININNNKTKKAVHKEVEEEENDALEDISNRLKRTWLLPSLSILDVSTGMTSSSLSLTHGHCAHARIIPQLARANISIRFVPNQDARKLISLVDKHIKDEFYKRRSPNEVTIQTTSCWNYWESSSEYDHNDDNKPSIEEASRRLLMYTRHAMKDAWGLYNDEKVLLVREGGSMAVLSLLQDILHAPTVQIPLATPKDMPHQEGESIPVLNLVRGAQVIHDVIQHVASSSSSSSSAASSSSSAAASSSLPLSR